MIKFVIMSISTNFDFHLLNQGYASLNGSWNYGPINSSFTRIYYVTDGESTVTISNKRHRLTPGKLFLIPALTSHYDNNNGPFSHYYIHCIDQSKMIINFYKDYNFPFEINATSQDLENIKRLHSLCPNIALNNYLPESYDNRDSLIKAIQRFQNLPLYIQIEIKGILLQLISRFFSQSSKKRDLRDDRIIKSLYTIEQNLSGRLSLDGLSYDASLSKDAFIRLFKAQTGETPTNYIIRQRIQQAQLMFIEGRRNVKEVAHSLGYDNVSYFGRLFKKVTDMSPMEFIRQNR